ncbi:outer membrane protein assembly factor BamB family protein [Haloarchaeobius litoreus]|uniref:PQQ-binding-like beta-propeller repeat protein n=1 Tax=Haloarchaeobius litoreus TaxID=755306 RepID=A0ABD6DMN0_9EURY|nr:PQQ-binding-like beta-propeller repeat protein [Haloarchaeobius litoreus]
MSPTRLSRRSLLAAGVGTLAGGQLLRPSTFRDAFDADPSVSTDEWLLPGRSPSRRNHVPVSGGTELSLSWERSFDGDSGYRVVVADGRAIVSVTDDAVYALEVSDGSIAWRARPRTGSGYGVALGGEHVCCSTGDGFYVLGREGNSKWWLPGYDYRTVERAGFLSTYLPVGSTLFTVGRGLEARGMESGLRHWVGERPDGSRLVANPLAFADGTLYCAGGRYGNYPFVAVDAEDGTQQWATAAFEYESRHLAVDGDTLLATGETEGGGRIQAFSTDDGALRWQRATSTQLLDPTVADGLVVCATEGRRLHAFDRATGERRWTVGRQAGVHELLRTDDHLYVHTPHGVEVRDPSTGDRQVRHEIAGSEPNGFAYAAGHLFALRGGRLFALEVVDGA